MLFLWGKERIYLWLITGDGRETVEKEADFSGNFNFLMHHLHGCGIVLSAGDKNEGKTEDG